MVRGLILSVKKKANKIIVLEPESNINENLFEISSLIIPFSVLFNENVSPDIYTGEELIPFRKRDVKFKEILLHEFSNIS